MGSRTHPPHRPHGGDGPDRGLGAFLDPRPRAQRRGPRADPRVRSRVRRRPTRRRVDPRVVIHRVPSLHPDDVTILHGIPVTTPTRTLIDCAELVTRDELRAMFAQAQAIGLLDPEALRAARGRVEWRPSL